jgi:YVTN family beta-propeller protein
MNWKLVSSGLFATLVGIVLATLVLPNIQIGSVMALGASQPLPQSSSGVGTVPRIINYQGYLKDISTGNPVSDGSRTAVFSLYTSASGGSAVWQETNTIVTNNGVFQTILGQTSSLDPSIVAVPELWMGVTLPPDAEMTPRQRVAGSVYSVGASEAQVSGTVAVNSEQIALRKWYDLNQGRPNRIDMAYTIQDVNSMASVTNPSDFSGDSMRAVDPYADIHSLGMAHQGSVIINAGNFLTQSQGHQHNLNTGGIWVSQCFSFTSLGSKVVCANDSELMIMANFEAKSGASGRYRSQRIACEGCRYTAYDGKHLWASDFDDGKLRRFDLTPSWSVAHYSNQTLPSTPPNTANNSAGLLHGSSYPFPDPPSVTASYDVGTNPLEVEYDGSRIWVANNADDTVTVLDASDGSLVATITVGDQPTRVLFDGASVWVLNAGDATITKIDAASQTVAGTFSTGAAPSDISFDGAKIWIANTTDYSITLLSATDGSLIGTLSLLGAPYHLQFDGVGTWIATYENQPAVTSSKGDPVTGTRWFVTRY